MKGTTGLLVLTNLLVKKQANPQMLIFKWEILEDAPNFSTRNLDQRLSMPGLMIQTRLAVQFPLPRVLPDEDLMLSWPLV